MARVLCISDLHIPAEHPRALEHCKKIYNEYNCDTVVFLGDIFDLHRASFHEHDPNMPSLADEIQSCIEKIKPWVKAFPHSMVCESNHDQRIFRVANKVGIPAFCVKDISDIFGLPKTWKFSDSFIIDDVRYSHGMDCKGNAGGMYASVVKHRRSQVYAHWHSFAGIQWSATETDLLFGFNVGCLIHNDHLAMRYGKWFANKPVIGCGVVINGVQPIFIPIDLGSKVEYKDEVDEHSHPILEAISVGSIKDSSSKVECLFDFINEYLPNLVATMPAIMVRWTKVVNSVHELPEQYKDKVITAIQKGKW